MTRRLISVLAVAVAGCLDVQDDVGLLVTVEEEGSFFADGRDHKTVIVEVLEDTGFGKDLTVTTTLGILNVAAGDAGAKKTRTVATRGSRSVEFELFAGTEPGEGEITVTAAGGLKATDTFVLLPPDGALDLLAPATVTTADENVTLTLQLVGASRAVPRVATVVATKGILTPGASGADASKLTVTMSSEQPANFNWQPGDEAGVALLTATLAGGEKDSASIAIERAVETVALAAATGPFLADDETIVPIQVSYDGPAKQARSIVITTSLGTLDSGKEAAASRTTTVLLSGGQSADVLLLTGRRPGTALLSAALAGSVVTTTTVALTHAAPSILGLSLDGASVLTQTVRKADVNLTMARPAGAGAVSTGTQVRFATCCDDGGGFDSCGRYLRVPPLATDTSGASTADVDLELTATGAAFVSQVGNPPADNLDATLYAYTLDATASGAALSCSELQDLQGPSSVVTALAAVGVSLQKVAP